MKRLSKSAGGVLVGLIGVALFLAVINLASPNEDGPPVTPTTTLPAFVPIGTVAPGPTPTQASPPDGKAAPIIPAPRGAADPSLTPTPSPTPSPVAFTLDIEQMQLPDTSVFLSATARVFLRGTVANLGDFVAHNTRIVARARVGDDYVRIDGRDTYVLELGNFPSKTATVRDVSFELKMSLIEANRAQSEGIIFETSIVSDEHTEVFLPMRCTQAGCGPLG